MISERVNPYDSTYEIRNPELFAGRKSELGTIEDQISKLSKGQHITPLAIIGDRRVGKSSLLLRAMELCEKYDVIASRITLNLTMAINPWELWRELFYELIKQLAHSEGFKEKGVVIGDKGLGFKYGPSQKETLVNLQFERVYNDYNTRAGSQILSTHIIKEDLTLLSDTISHTGQNGLFLIIDEAHHFQLLQDKGSSMPLEIKSQIREVIQSINNCGIIFSGEPILSTMFNSKLEPFYAQGNIIALKNFSSREDIIECALLPLQEEERALMSPMTIDYLTRLSQGKPNQVRLICEAIYDRFLNDEQQDLEITINILDDVITKVETGLTLDYDLKLIINKIKNLRSVDLEMLYNLNRYPDWSVNDIIDLDESFRAENRSFSATERRKKLLAEKREGFILMGLMVDAEGRYLLEGDEFLYLYLRFWYQIRKYGQLSKQLVLGKGPQTSFGEKAHKLVEAIAWELRRGPGIQRYIFHPDESEHGEIIIDRIRASCNILNDMAQGSFIVDDNTIEDINNCFSLCELVSEPGKYYLLCLSIRNRDNPRELMQIELYFKYSELNNIDLVAFTNIVNKQVEDARIFLEGCDTVSVELFNIPKLLEALKGPTMRELLSSLPAVGRWHISSVQHILDKETKTDAEHPGEETKDSEAKLVAEGISIYASGNAAKAEEFFTKELQTRRSRESMAILYNNRGYIRHSLKKYTEAKKDLERALDLHHVSLPLTLLNLSMVAIVEEDYHGAVSFIDDALFLMLNRAAHEAGYLRVMLPKTHLAYFRTQIEQRPANLFDIAYTNLAYVHFMTRGLPEAMDVLEEGISILPSSTYLKYAKARYLISDKRADLATPIFIELSKSDIENSVIKQEVGMFVRSLPRLKRNPRK